MISTEDRINLRTSTERKQFLAKAASYCGTSLSAFLLDAAEQRAHKVLKKQTQIQLSEQDWQAFTKILDNAESKPRPNLEKLVNDHR